MADGHRPRWAHSRARDLDPWREHDACGVGFVARASGERSADVTRLALQALARVAHRGAAATDRSGDGAGLLTQIPLSLFYREAASRGLALERGQPFAVGAFFLPRSDDALCHATRIIEDVLRGDGITVLGWRDVPVDPDVLGAGARATLPAIRQVVLAAPADGGRRDEAAWERALYLARRTIERRVAEVEPSLEPFFACSLSCRTLVYKALLTGTQLAGFYPDLVSPDFETAIAIFHQRYSTNTTSSWPLAQPFRMLAHNGEINTLWGNRNAMRAREPALTAPVWGEGVERLKPVIWSEGSDSASLDNALELLVRSGRDPVHALMMLVPEAHEGAVEMDPALRGFYEFHECLVEPWTDPRPSRFRTACWWAPPWIATDSGPVATRSRAMAWWWPARRSASWTWTLRRSWKAADSARASCWSWTRAATRSSTTTMQSARWPGSVPTTAGPPGASSRSDPPPDYPTHRRSMRQSGSPGRSPSAGASRTCATCSSQ